MLAQLPGVMACKSSIFALAKYKIFLVQSICTARLCDMDIKSADLFYEPYNTVVRF